MRSPESQGLPSENNEIPVDFERLTKQLEHTLDLRSLIGGKRHIKAEVGMHWPRLAPITQLQMCVIKKVTFKGGHLMW